MANHEPFTNHILRDWESSGPDRGVGSKARVHVSAGGKRVANGTYTLSALPDGGTHVQFEYTWQQIPLSERMMSPVVRGMMRRANERAMHRLAERLQAVVGV
jgi:hypothetical protein